VASLPPFSDQCVLALNHCPIIDALGWKPASPRYLLDLDKEMPQSVVDLLGVDVIGGELEAIVAGSEVARDVVAIGSRAPHWFMVTACCREGGAGEDS
jgi:hypothetical protein